MTLPDQEQPLQGRSQTRNPLRVALIYQIFALAAVAVTFFLSRGMLDWQVVMLRLAAIVAALAALVGVLAIRNGQTNFGTWFLIGGLWFEVLAVSIFLQGFGFFLLFVAAALTALTVRGTLPQRQSRWAVIIGGAVGIAALLVDQITAGADYRFTAPGVLQPIGAVLVVLLIAYVGIVIARQFGNLPLRTKMVVAFMLVTVLSLALLGFLNERNIRTVLTEEAKEALFASASEVSASVDAFITTNRSAVRSEASIPAFVNYLSLPPEQRGESPLRAEASNTLRALSRKDVVRILSYALLDATGTNVLDTVSVDIGQSEADSDYFQQPYFEGESFVSEVDFTPEAGQFHALIFSSPVRDISGNILGVLRVRYAASTLQEIVRASNDRAGEGSFGVLFAELEGNYIHLGHGIAPETLYTAVVPFESGRVPELQADHRLPMSTMLDTLELNLPELYDNLEDIDQTTFFTATDIATGELVNQVAQVQLGEKPNWIMAYFQPRDVFLSVAQEQTQTTVFLGIVIAAAVFGLAIALSQVIASPIAALTEISERVSEGDFSARAPIVTDDEIGALATSFNRMTAQLQSMVGGLEDQVADRTRDLERRTQYLRLAAETARDATAELELDDLLDRAVSLTRARFDFYHVGIFLVDDKGEYAVLRAATEETGHLMLERQYRVAVGSDTAVGYVTFYGEPRLVSGLGEDVTTTQAAMLPGTRSKMVLPLRVGEDVLGALDIHSTRSDAFDENDLALFRTLADQLAVAIQKTVYRYEVEQALRQLEAAYGEYTRASWQEFAQGASTPLGYRYDLLGIKPSSEQSEVARRAWDQRQAVLEPGEKDGGGGTLAVPMLVRGEPVGVLNLQFDEESVSSEARDLIEDVANRLGLVLENARLLEESQRRAERERLLGEVAGRMRESLDIDNVMQNTIEEIVNRLGIRDVEIRMATGIDASERDGRAMAENGDVFDGDGAGETSEQPS